MTQPVISVCVVTYNQSQFIETCLRSVLNQEVDAEVRVLVGDDGSNDGTSEVIQALAKEYGSKIQCLIRDSNIGAFANMCDLLSRADGDFIARVDGDDFWLPGKLSSQLAYLQADGSCDAVYTNALTVDEAGRRIGVFNDVGDKEISLSELLRRGNFLNNSSVLFRSKNIRIWTADERCIDYQVHLSQATNGCLAHLGDLLTAYRVKTRGSMVVFENSSVRQLYWQAIQSVPRELVSDYDYACGLADFLRRVFFRSVRTLDSRVFMAWARQVYERSPFGFVLTSALVLANVLRQIGKGLASILTASSARKNVLYRY